MNLDVAALLGRSEWQAPCDRLRERYAGARVLVTGAAGSIGTEIGHRLVDLGAEQLICVDHHEPSLYRLGLDLGGADRVQLVLADARDSERLGALLLHHRIDAVVHLAAYKHVPLGEANADQVALVNIFSTLDLARGAMRAGTRDFLYPSTDKAVRPPSIYGCSKRLAEVGLRAAMVENSMRIRISRLVNVIGTAGNVIEVFARQIAAGQDLTITDERMTRYWMSRREAADLLLLSAVARPGEVFLLNVGEAVPLVETARRLAMSMGVTILRTRSIGARPGERLQEHLAYSWESRVPTDIKGIDALVGERAHSGFRRGLAALRRNARSGDSVATRAEIDRLIAQVGR